MLHRSSGGDRQQRVFYLRLNKDLLKVVTVRGGRAGHVFVDVRIGNEEGVVVLEETHELRAPSGYRCRVRGTVVFVDVRSGFLGALRRRGRWF